MQIRALYEALLRVSDNPVVALNHVVAVAMADGPEAGQDRLTEVAADPRIAEHPRFHAVSAHLLEMAGDVRCRPGGVRRGRPAEHQHPAAALPARPGRPAGAEIRRRRWQNPSR